MLFPNHVPFPPQARANKPARPQVQAPILPKVLEYDGRPLVRSGPGKAKGSYIYLDLARNRTMELYLVRVTSVTAMHTFTTVPGNPGLAVVCVANNEVPPGAAVGHWLLVGPVGFDPDGLARARHAWRSPVPAQRRYSGIVCRVHPTGRFGEIAGPDGKKLFFHVSDLPHGIVPGVNLLVGQAVTYREKVTPKGWNAREVRFG